MAEEVKNPDRNLPASMLLSLATATILYVLGIYVLIAVLDTEQLRGSLTPVADAADNLFQWLPLNIGVYAVVISAIAAFTSTGNGGLLSASRYPMAMVKDQLLPEKLSKISKFDTPILSVILTASLMVVFELLLDPRGVAELASATQLLIFAIINLCVIVLRESKIKGYRPGFRSWGYPWMQIFGIIGSLGLITTLSGLPILVALIVIGGGMAWFFYYAKDKVIRKGAHLHVFEQLGEQKHEELGGEMEEIKKRSEEAEQERKEKEE